MAGRAIAGRRTRQVDELPLGSLLGQSISRRYVMRKKLDKLFSRRDFWKVTGVGSLVGSQMLQGKALKKGEAKIIEDYGGPTPPVDEVVLFPFDDFSIPLRY